MQRSGHERDLFDKERPTARLFENAALRSHSAWHDAFGMPEQLTFKGVLWRRTTMNCHEGLAASRGLGVDRTCQDFFSCTGFTGEQGGGLVGRSPFDHLKNFDHRVRSRDDGAFSDRANGFTF